MKKVIIIGLIAGAIYLGTRKTEPKTVTAPSLQEKKDFIIEYLKQNGTESEISSIGKINEILNKLTVDEINVVYTVFLNMTKNIPTTDEYMKKIMSSIAERYGIFT